MNGERITIAVRYRFQEELFNAVIDESMLPIMQEAFKPMRRVTDPVYTLIDPGAVVEGSMDEQKVIQLRKDAAEIIAKELADRLVDAMKQADTINGYPVEVQGVMQPQPFNVKEQV